MVMPLRLHHPDGRFKVKSTIDINFFQVMSHDLAWFLGLSCADGNIEATLPRFNLAQSGPEGRSILDHVARMTGWTGQLQTRKTSGRDSHALRFTSKEVCDILANYGIIPNKTHTLTFPKTLPPEYHSSFIRGYVDGDGSIGTYKVGGSNKFLVLSLVGTPSLVSSVSDIVPSPKHHLRSLRGCTEVRWNGQNAFVAARWIYLNPPNENLPETKKSLIWRNYEQYLRKNPTRWLPKYI